MPLFFITELFGIPNKINNEKNTSKQEAPAFDTHKNITNPFIIPKIFKINGKINDKNNKGAKQTIIILNLDISSSVYAKK